jgi:hypothetical protein
VPVTHSSKILNKKTWIDPHLVSIEPQDLSPQVLAMIQAGGGGGIVSLPPIGCYKVINIYVDADGKLVVKWSDTPQGA